MPLVAFVDIFLLWFILDLLLIVGGSLNKLPSYLFCMLVMWYEQIQTRKYKIYYALVQECMIILDLGGRPDHLQTHLTHLEMPSMVLAQDSSEADWELMERSSLDQALNMCKAM